LFAKARRTGPQQSSLGKGNRWARRHWMLLAPVLFTATLALL